jgi:predicted RNase H-like nuclease (RuvC/YqgF family)
MPKENLKKSKSLEQLEVPKVELARSKSAEPSSFTDPKYPYTTLISQSQEIEELKKETKAKSTTISLLRKKIGELEKSNPPNLLLQEQLAEKQRVIESLRKQLEEKNIPTETSTELDNSLFARHQNLKD